MTRRFILATCALCALLVGAPSALARPAKKPSIRFTGVSVNRVNVSPGTTITPDSPTNACYEIGGPAASPPQVDVFFFLHAVSIPKSARTTMVITTPWDTQRFPNQLDPGTEFKDDWHIDRGHNAATIFGGPTGPYDFYTYDDEGTRGNRFAGKYSISVTVRVRGKSLHAHASINVECQD